MAATRFAIAGGSGEGVSGPGTWGMMGRMLLLVKLSVLDYTAWMPVLLEARKNNGLFVELDKACEDRCGGFGWSELRGRQSELGQAVVERLAGPEAGFGVGG